nr:Domain of unknown function DUF1741 [Hymenolepis microstoma]
MQKSLPKEKGQDITSGRAEFWDEFFLLRVNVKVLLSYFDRVSLDRIVELKIHLNRLYDECLQKALNTSHWLRIANALQTSDCLMLGAFRVKNLDIHPADKLKLLIPSERSESAKNEYLKLCTTSFAKDWPPLLQELVIESLIIRCILSDNVNDNPIFDWLLDENLFELLGTLISNACLRQRFAVGACRLLGIISQYRWKEINNLYLMKLAQVKDEILLNGISAVISFTISESTRKYNEYVQASGGLFSSISSMFGGRKVDGQWQDFSVLDGLLLCLYVIIRQNPRFPSLLSCSHTHIDTHQHNRGASIGQLNEFGDEELGPHPDPRNLMADLIEFTSVVMQGIKDSPERLITCSLCFKIISQATKNLYVCLFLHEYNVHFTIQLHRAHLRHRKSAVCLMDRSSSNTMAAILLDLLVEFFCTHLMKSFPFEIHGLCLDICYHLLSHQKEYSIRLNYDWRQLWKVLFDLMKFVTKREGPVICEETFTTLLKIVGIFNFFIIYGDCFLLGPSTYDDLYYELIRRKDAIEQLIKFADQYSSTSEGGWKSLAMELRDSINNLEAIVRHYNMKISAFISNGSVASLTEDQAMEIIQSNYASLNLRVYDKLHKHYEPIAEYVEASDEEMLVGIVKSFRRSCLESSIAYQSRFDELAVIH